MVRPPTHRREAFLSNARPHTTQNTSNATLSLLFFPIRFRLYSSPRRCWQRLKGISNEAENIQRQSHLRPRRALTQDSDSGDLVLTVFSMEAAEAQVVGRCAVQVLSRTSGQHTAIATTRKHFYNFLHLNLVGTQLGCSPLTLCSYNDNYCFCIPLLSLEHISTCQLLKFLVYMTINAFVSEKTGACLQAGGKVL